MGRLSAGVWDFVGEQNYTHSFSTQWAEFRHVQFDSVNGTTISRERFQLVTGWSEEDVHGQRVLDGGCGAGRYSEVASDMGACLTAIDLSEAAYTARANLDGREDVTVVRGDLLAPPLAPRWFDKVFSIGVLQHTPDPLSAAQRLFGLVRPGGELVIWMYERRWHSPLLPKYLMRHVTRRLPSPVVNRLSAGLVRVVTPLARGIGRIPSPRARRVVKACLPIASYWGELPLRPEQQVQWSVLDTRDWLTPAFDIPKTYDDVRAALLEAGADNVRQKHGAGGLTVSATRSV